jgi:hypothetical protein
MDNPEEQSLVPAYPSEPPHIEEMRKAIKKGDSNALAASLATHEVFPLHILFRALKGMHCEVGSGMGNQIGRISFEDTCQTCY